MWTNAAYDPGESRMRMRMYMRSWDRRHTKKLRIEGGLVLARRVQRVHAEPESLWQTERARKEAAARAKTCELWRIALRRRG